MFICYQSKVSSFNGIRNCHDIVYLQIAGTSLFGYLLSKFDPVNLLDVCCWLNHGIITTNKLSAGVLGRHKSSQSSCRTFTEESEPYADNIVIKVAKVIKLSWKEYLGQLVLPVSLAWVLLYFNAVLSPSSLMTAFLTQCGLHPSIIGGFSGLCAFMGVAATFVSSALVKHLGILKAGAAGLVFQALLLSMAVAVYWSGSISQQSPLLFLLYLITLSRLGPMSYDAVWAQIVQMGIPASKANLIGTTEIAIASLAESIMLGVAMVANDISHFGILAILSLLSLVGAAWMFCRWLLNPTEGQKCQIHRDPQFC